MSVLKSLLLDLIRVKKPVPDAIKAEQKAAAVDQRVDIYRDLHSHQLVDQEEANRISAHRILSGLFKLYRPKSILDVGCGIGTWLACARDLGVEDVFGIDGDWLDVKLAKVPAQMLETRDLEQSFNLGRRFELVICLEVAEHLSQDAAARFVESLTSHADVILFSAAIPFQGGHHHVNEQFPDYWRKIFGARGFSPIDCIRHSIWDDTEVMWWLRQNIMIFAKPEFAAGNGPFAGCTNFGPLSVVHPDVYMARVGHAQRVLVEHDQLLELLGTGKPVVAERGPKGELRIHCIDQL